MDESEQPVAVCAWVQAHREALNNLYAHFLADNPGLNRHTPGATFDEFCARMHDECDHE